MNVCVSEGCFCSSYVWVQESLHCARCVVQLAGPSLTRIIAWQALLHMQLA